MKHALAPLYLMTFIGCAAPVALEPIYDRPPDVAPVPSVAKLPEREAPMPERIGFSVAIAYQKPVMQRNVDFTARQGALPKEGARVVIGIPTAVREQLRSRSKNAGRTRSPSSEDDVREARKKTTLDALRGRLDDLVEVGRIDRSTAESIVREAERRLDRGEEIEELGEGIDASAVQESFSTVEYFNRFEQAIEAALIERGLRVMDRIKLEAKLRDLRDDQGKRNVEGLALENRKKRIKEQIDGGDIDFQEGIRKLQELEKEYTRGGGTKRDVAEMTDNAEVIRAVMAKSTQKQRRYLLQINQFTVERIEDKRLRLDLIAEGALEAFEARYPGVLIPKSVEVPWFEATCNAKLIDIENGDIVWTGLVRINSDQADPEGLKWRFSALRQVENGGAVNMAIRKHNMALDALTGQCSGYRDEYKRMLGLASKQIDAATKEKAENKKETLTAYVERAKKAYGSCLHRLKSLATNPAPNTDASWTYRYLHESWAMEPDLFLVREKAERYFPHMEALGVAAAQALVGALNEG